MKKVLFLLFVVVTFEAVAQLDTIPLGERDPKYYYWDTNWWDYHYFNSPVNQISPSATIDHIGYFVHGQGSGLCKPEFARWCYTDHPLKVVGVAAVITRVFPYEVSETPAPGSYYDVLPEYLRLYEYDSTMSMVLMAEALTDTARAQSYLRGELA